MAEIIEVAWSLLGDAPAEHGRQFIADVTKLLAESGDTHHMSRSEIGHRELAETMCATSHGLKHRVATPTEYRDRMAIALRIFLLDDRHRPKDMKSATPRKHHLDTGHH